MTHSSAVPTRSLTRPTKEFVSETPSCPLEQIEQEFLNIKKVFPYEAEHLDIYDFCGLEKGQLLRRSFYNAICRELLYEKLPHILEKKDYSKERLEAILNEWLTSEVEALRDFAKVFITFQETIDGTPG